MVRLNIIWVNEDVSKVRNLNLSVHNTFGVGPNAETVTVMDSQGEYQFMVAEGTTVTDALMDTLTNMCSRVLTGELNQTMETVEEVPGSYDVIHMDYEDLSIYWLSN